MVNLSPQPVFQLCTGIAILVWYFWGLSYRMKEAAKYDLSLLDIDMPQWHENAFWPLLILLIAGLVWGAMI